MKPRTLRYLVGALIVLVALYAGVSWLRSGQAAPGEDSDLARALASVDTSRLAAVEIAGVDDSVILRRVDGGWRVIDHAADSAAVADLVSSLAALELAELASSNPANHGRLGLSPGEARSVRVSGDGWGPVDLRVGSAGPYAGSAYLRLEGSDRAWVVRGGIRGATPTGLDAWRDRTVATVDTAGVQTLRLRRGDETAELRRSGNGWTVAVASSGGEAAAARSGTVRELLGQLARLRASGFAPDSAAMETAHRELTALSAEGDTLVRLRLEERSETGSFWLTRDGEEAVYALGSLAADRLVPATDDLTEAGGSGTDDA